jgi:hypothetical protein
VPELRGVTQKMNVQVQDPVEKVQHQRALENLCEEFPEVRERLPELYEEIYSELAPGATIRTFISIFISRELREKLRSRQGLNS